MTTARLPVPEMPTGRSSAAKSGPAVAVFMFGHPVEIVYESPEPVEIQLPTLGKSTRVMICAVRDAKQRTA